MSETATAVASPSSSGGSDAGTPSAAHQPTFADAFARDASPTSPSPDASTTPPAAAQPGGDQGSPQQTEDPRSPFIPRARFDEVNTKLNELKAWKEQRAWADQTDKATYDEAVQLAQRFQTDKIGYIRDLIADMQADPVLGPQLRSEAARALAAGRGQQAPTMPEPDVAITDGNGNVVGATYSEKALAQRDAFLMHKVMAQVDEKYAPVIKTHEDIAAERQTLRDQVEGEKFATGLMQEVSTYPRFTENKAAIKADVVRQIQQYAPNDPRTNDPAFLESATLRAYIKVVGPTLTAQGESSMLASLKQKASAATSVNPGSAAPSSPRGVTSFLDKSLQW